MHQAWRQSNGGAQSVEIIEALSTHPQLEKLELDRMDVGRNECSALANLLRITAANLQELDLSHNGIDDEGVDILVGALTNCRLRSFKLSSNHNITARGWQSLAALLENPNCNFEVLNLSYNNIGDEGARIFVNALTNNCRLKTLDLYWNDVTAEGFSSFSEVLCDTSSINNIFLSNHTLESFGDDVPSRSIPADVRSLLALNRSNQNKKQVALRKILNHHNYFDMRPFFEWELKVLPIAINWFEQACGVCTRERIVVMRKRKLEAIYQFIRAMPEVFEPVPAPAIAGEKRKRSGSPL